MLEQARCGLLVVDVQGSLAKQVHDNDKVVANISLLIRAAELLEMPVVTLEQYPRGLGPTVQALQEKLPQSPLRKTSFNGIEHEAIEQVVRDTDRSQWLVCGIESHICVYQTTRGLVEAGFEAEVIVDAVSARHQLDTQVALEKCRDIGAGITTLELCLYELLGTSLHEQFKEILPLVKAHVD
ncbi:Nicotinamidase-related amidase [Ferrimonas sediminum]|uniref:Nicotinamidase-related amidase n=1 Tax=Ferrimonas sediminum TaxID=718193 RepID=A0A1G8YBX8_9GAMM|nr:isochorismatase family protein [Ferrimonas sediminum]SDJ99560.1 Nicotinamidase-related amidase [Ferrimonas sediminum]